MSKKEFIKQIKLIAYIFFVFPIVGCSTLSKTPEGKKQAITKRDGTKKDYQWREWSKWPIIETIGVPFNLRNGSTDVSLDCMYDVKDSISFCICNNSSDTIYVFRTYMASEFSVYSNNFWKYDKKSHCTYLSYLPWEGMLSGARALLPDLLKSCEPALYSKKYLHYTFYGIPPKHKLERELQVWNIADDEEFQKKNKHFSLDNIVLQIAYYKDVDLLVKPNAMYLKPKECHEQELSYKTIECTIHCGK